MSRSRSRMRSESPKPTLGSQERDCRRALNRLGSSGASFHPSFLGSVPVSFDEIRRPARTACRRVRTSCSRHYDRLCLKLARYVEYADWISARIAGCGIASNMPVCVTLRIAVCVVDIDVAVGGKGWLQGYA